MKVSFVLATLCFLIGCQPHLWRADIAHPKIGTSYENISEIPEVFWWNLAMTSGVKMALGNALERIETSSRIGYGSAKQRPIICVSEELETKHEYLVWVQKMQGRESLHGILMLVKMENGYVLVKGAGIIQVPKYGKIDLNFVDLGEFHAARVIVQRCSNIGVRTGECHKIVRFVPLEKMRFVGGMENDGQFYLMYQGSVKKDKMWNWRIDYAADVELCQGTIIMSEKMTWSKSSVQGKKRHDASQLTHQIESLHSIRWENGAWIRSDPALWQKVLKRKSI